MSEESAVDDLNEPEPPGVLEGMTREEREEEFFRLLHRGCTVRQAAAGVKIDWSQLYRKRREDAEFAKRWENALRISVDHLVREAERRAMRGSDKLLMFLLERRDPERFGNRQSIDVTNSDGSMQPGDTDRASRVEAMLAIARTRKAAKEIADLL